MKNLILLTILLLPLLTSGQKTRVLELNNKWKFTIGDRDEYKDVDYDDSSWESIRVGTPWENQGFANYNGYAWYRYEFDGLELGGFTNLMINLGYIDDVHEAYFNETLIGFKGSFPPDFYTAYDALNEYAIPSSAINEGRNVIAIKVYDVYRDGGMVKGRPSIYFEVESFENFHSLEGVWKFSTTRNPYWEKGEFDDGDWENIVVPSFWRSKHIKRSNGYGWYRKEFRLPDNLKGKDVYLVLGKIDDFDYTYVNGKLVGRTKDFLLYGMSDSYRQTRMYKVPKELLDADGINTIAIEVEDMGGEAGLYEGPVGIAANVESKRSKK